METNLRTTDLDGVTIGDIGFAGDIGECDAGKQEEAEECVDVLHDTKIAFTCYLVNR